MRVGLFVGKSVVLSMDCRPLSSFHPGGQPQEESQKKRYARIEPNRFVRKRAMKVRRGGERRYLCDEKANEKGDQNLHDVV